MSQMNISQNNVTILRKTQIFLEAYIGEPIIRSSGQTIRSKKSTASSPPPVDPSQPPQSQSPKNPSQSPKNPSQPALSNFLLRFSIEQGDAVYSPLNPSTHRSVVLPIFYYPKISDATSIYSDIIKKIVTPPQDNTIKIRGQILREMIGLDIDKEFNPLFGFDIANYLHKLTSLNIQSLAILIFSILNEISYFIVYLMKKSRVKWINQQNRPNVLTLLYTSLTRSIPTSLLDAKMQEFLDKLLKYLRLYDVLFGIVHILVFLFIIVPGSKKSPQEKILS